MSERSPVRTVLTIVMDLLIVLSLAVTVRLVVSFFGSLSATAVGEVIIAFTNPIVLPLGIEPIKTPYGGVFDVNAAVTIGLLLLVEWVLSIARSRAD